METKKCLYCKNEFPAKVSWQAFCCGSHRVLFSRKQDAGLLNNREQKFADAIDEIQDNPKRRFFYKSTVFWQIFNMKNKYHCWMREVNPSDAGAYQVLELQKEGWTEITEKQFNDLENGKDFREEG